MRRYLNIDGKVLDHRLKKIEIQPKPKVYDFTLDHLRLNVNRSYRGEFLNSLFHGYSLNSPQKYGVTIFGHVFDTYYSEWGENRKILYLDYLGDKLIVVEKFLDAGATNADISYQITFHSTYFYIEELNGIVENVIRDYLPYISVGRLDIAMDTNVSVSELWLTNTTHFRNTWSKVVNKQVQTFYLGNKDKNPRHFIRVYDKKEDSRKKGKFHIFGDYLREETVTRVEAQINVDSCKALGITPLNVLDRDRCFTIYKSLCLNIDATNFPQLPRSKGAVIKRMNRTKTIRAEDAEKIFYLRVFYGYARKLDEMGLNVPEMVKNYLEDLKSQQPQRPIKIPQRRRGNT